MAVSLVRPNVIFALDASADTSYQKTTTSDRGVDTGNTIFNESYTFGINHNLTSTILISGEVRMQKTVLNGKETSETYPLFYLNYTPPMVELYYISLGYSRNETVPPGGQPTTASNTSASFTLPSKKWPSIALSYNQSATSDYRDPHKFDSVTINQSFNSSYGFSFLNTETNFNYSFSEPVSIDRVEKTRSETKSHSASGYVLRSFWDSKIDARANIGYDLSDNSTKSIGSPQQFSVVRTASEGLYAIDNTPTVDALVSTPALINNDFISQAGGINLTAANRNIGIHMTTSQPVFKINLYISTSDPLISSYNFGWSVYTSSDGINWTTLTGVTTEYEATQHQRIVFKFATETSARYFKVVNTVFPVAALSIEVAEIEAIGFITDTPTQELKYITTREFGGFNLSLKPFERLSMTYGFDYDLSTNDLDDRKFTTLGHGLGLNSIIMPEYIIFSANYSTTKTNSISRTNASQTDVIDSYAVTISSSPLPTVNAGINYGYSETLTNGVAHANTNSFGGYISMNIYKGVDFNIGNNISASKDPQSSSNSNSVNYYANINFVPWRSTNIIINGSNSNSTIETGGSERSTSSQSLNTSVLYAPSRNIYFSSSINIEPTSSQSYGITWLPPFKSIQTSFRYGTSEDDENMGADISWTPFPKLILRFSYNVSKTGDNQTDSVLARASLRL